MWFWLFRHFCQCSSCFCRQCMWMLCFNWEIMATLASLKLYIPQVRPPAYRGCAFSHTRLSAWNTLSLFRPQFKRVLHATIPDLCFRNLNVLRLLIILSTVLVLYDAQWCGFILTFSSLCLSIMSSSRLLLTVIWVLPANFFHPYNECSVCL